MFVAVFAPLALSQTPSTKIYHPPPTLPLTSFYDTPEPLPAGKPGQLIRAQQFDEYRLSYEVSVYRILYHSVSPQGKDVAASGVVLLPEGTPPAGGWPIVAWAHDFTGSARACAPSLLKNLKEGPLLSMYANAGYTVVATDYAGLGTNFPPAGQDIRSNALDVIYSIQAARAALPQLGGKWVVAGYSQGAQVAVGVAEAAEVKGDSNYLGAVAISGFAEPLEIFERIAADGPNYSLVLSLAHGIKTVYPEFRVEDMLTDKGMLRYRESGQSCETKPNAESTARDLLKPGWEHNRYVESFFSRNNVGENDVHGPLLVISGDSDAAVPSALTAKAVSRLCGQKARVLFVSYPGLSSSAALSNSVSEQLSWIQARSAGRDAPSNCP
jgi:pimeloyl-ACP methyl ester carboxylesterase